MNSEATDTSLGAAPGFQLAALVGNRKVVLSLPARGDPHVECGAWGGSRSLSRRMGRLIATSHVEHLATCIHCRSELDSRQGLFFQLFRHSQGLVQERPEIGLDDVELTPGYRDLLRKIVDNNRAGPSDRITTIPRQLGIPTTLSVGAAGQAQSALSPSLPGWTSMTRPAAGIDPGDPGCRQRTGFPPHCTIQLL